MNNNTPPKFPNLYKTFVNPEFVDRNTRTLLNSWICNLTFYFFSGEPVKKLGFFINIPLLDEGILVTSMKDVYYLNLHTVEASTISGERLHVHEWHFDDRKRLLFLRTRSKPQGFGWKQTNLMSESLVNTQVMTNYIYPNGVVDNIPRELVSVDEASLRFSERTSQFSQSGGPVWAWMDGIWAAIGVQQDNNSAIPLLSAQELHSLYMELYPSHKNVKIWNKQDGLRSFYLHNSSSAFGKVSINNIAKVEDGDDFRILPQANFSTGKEPSLSDLPFAIQSASSKLYLSLTYKGSKPVESHLPNGGGTAYCSTIAATSNEAFRLIAGSNSYYLLSDEAAAPTHTFLRLGNQETANVQALPLQGTEEMIIEPLPFTNDFEILAVSNAYKVIFARSGGHLYRAGIEDFSQTEYSWIRCNSPFPGSIVTSMATCESQAIGFPIFAVAGGRLFSSRDAGNSWTEASGDRVTKDNYPDPRKIIGSLKQVAIYSEDRTPKIIVLGESGETVLTNMNVGDYFVWWGKDPKKRLTEITVQGGPDPRMWSIDTDGKLWTVGIRSGSWANWAMDWPTPSGQTFKKLCGWGDPRRDDSLLFAINAKSELMVLKMPRSTDASVKWRKYEEIPDQKPLKNITCSPIGMQMIFAVDIENNIFVKDIAQERWKKNWPNAAGALPTLITDSKTHEDALLQEEPEEA
ncbi:hypothetical protein D3C87_741890 [compost metagenome]